MIIILPGHFMIRVARLRNKRSMLPKCESDGRKKKSGNIRSRRRISISQDKDKLQSVPSLRVLAPWFNNPGVKGHLVLGAQPLIAVSHPGSVRAKAPGPLRLQESRRLKPTWKRGLIST